MSVIECQFLNYRNILSYTHNIKDEDVLFFAQGISNNICVLDMNLNGNIVITKNNGSMEFLIPVDKKVESSKHYKFKPEFKLVNAVSVRHYGSFSTIGEKLEELNEYINENILVPVTQPYYIIRDLNTEVYDIFIGISENIL